MDGNYLMGVRHWAMWYEGITPRFAVFRYLGFDQRNGMHWFENIRSGARIGKNYYQLKNSPLVPFCINTNRIWNGVLQDANKGI